MNYKLTNSSAFPLVLITLNSGEEIKTESGAMVYHNGKVTLEGKMNSNGSGGIGGLLKAAAIDIEEVVFPHPPFWFVNAITWVFANFIDFLKP